LKPATYWLDYSYLDTREITYLILTILYIQGKSDFNIQLVQMNYLPIGCRRRMSVAKAFGFSGMGERG
jgi:hypothetical protein